MFARLALPLLAAGATAWAANAPIPIAELTRTTPVDFDRMTTRHGVVVTSDREGHLAFALRWSGAEPGTASELGALALDRA